MPIKVMFDTALTDVWTTAAEKGSKPGDLRWEGNKAYKCVQYTVAPVAGNLQKYATGATYDANQVSATTSQITPVAGVAVASGLINQFGWMQIRGTVTLTAPHTGTPAVGDALGPSASLGALALWVTPRQVVATAIDATSRALLNCPY